MVLCRKGETLVPSCPLGLSRDQIYTVIQIVISESNVWLLTFLHCFFSHLLWQSLLGMLASMTNKNRGIGQLLPTLENSKLRKHTNRPKLTNFSGAYYMGNLIKKDIWALKKQAHHQKNLQHCEKSIKGVWQNSINGAWSARLRAGSEDRPGEMGHTRFSITQTSCAEGVMIHAPLSTHWKSKEFSGPFLH